MQSFMPILWRHVRRYGLIMWLVGASGLLLFNWYFYHDYPTHRRIVLYFSGLFIAMVGATVSNAWMEWHRSIRVGGER